MKRLLALSVICLIINCLFAQKPLSLASSFYNTLNNYVLYNDHIEYQKLMNMCDAGFRVSDRFAQEQTDIPSPSLLLQNYLELLRDKQVKLAITDMREITLSNHRTEGASTKTVLVNLTLSSPKTSTYKLQNVVYIRNNKIFCIGDYEIDKSGKVLTELVNKTNRSSTNNNIHNGHEYVDLGLSVMWATCNVGASRPEEFGNYYAWGEVAPKKYYDWTTYKYCNGSYKTLTKYNTVSDFGLVDNKTTLEPNDDAATANWGGEWRTPTKAELEELRKYCTWEWIIIHGIQGSLITSEKNGNTIFWPASGYIYRNSTEACNHKEQYLGGPRGYYWSNVISSSKPYSAYSRDNDDCTASWSYGSRVFGHTIRPVCTLH